MPRGREVKLIFFFHLQSPDSQTPFDWMDFRVTLDLGTGMKMEKMNLKMQVRETEEDASSRATFKLY